MLTSMTGFGRSERRGRLGIASVELRSVNHRYLEVGCRLPDSLAGLEDSVRALVQQRVHRGKVTVTVTVQGRPTVTATVSPSVARQYLVVLRHLQRQLKVPGMVTLEQLTALPGVLIPAATDTLSAWRFPVLSAAKAALRQLVRGRQREGDILARALRGIAHRLERASAALAARAPHVVSEYQARLETRIRALTAQPLEPGRLEQEVALLATACDIAEERTRINAHVAHLRDLLASRVAVGRTLDFVAQELQREVNTVGSKANDVEVARLAIQMKGWVEQLREQAQNVE